MTNEEINFGPRYDSRNRVLLKPMEKGDQQFKDSNFIERIGQADLRR